MKISTDYETSLSNARQMTAEVAGAKLKRIDHRFYTAMSVAVAITVFAGFAESFYLKSYFHKPAIHPVTLIHGLLNTGWILLFVIQNCLVATGRVGIHRRLGWAGALLSLLILPFGIATGIDAVRQGHIVNAPDIYAFLLTFSFRNTLIFGLLMTAAIYLRRNSEAHKRFALLAAVALFSEPAIGRIPGISFPLIVLLVNAFIFAGPVYDFITRRRVHPVYLWAVPAMLILSPLTPLTTTISRTAAWHDFTNWLVR